MWLYPIRFTFAREMALLIDADRHYVFFHSEEADFHKDITTRSFPKYDKIVAVGPGVEILLRENFRV